MWIRALIALVLFVSTARAEDKVALLALDAQGRFEVYGPAVASEIARTLIGGKIDVLVVLPKMSVPTEAKLIVDGKISATKTGAIDLVLRMREPNETDTTKMLDFKVTAKSLETLDKAANEVAQKLLPALRDKLVELEQRKPSTNGTEPVKPPPIRVDPRPTVAPARPLLVAIKAGKSEQSEPLRAALAEAVPAWAASHRRAPHMIEASSLIAHAPKTVAGSNADRAISFEILDYKLFGGGEKGEVPLGTARVRVRIADAATVLFDRVVVTDTIVGEKQMSKEQFVQRVAQEVLAILHPHARRNVPGW